MPDPPRLVCADTVLWRQDTSVYDHQGQLLRVVTGDGEGERGQPPQNRRKKSPQASRPYELRLTTTLSGRLPLLTLPDRWRHYQYTTHAASVTLDSLNVVYQWLLSLFYLSYTKDDPVNYLSGCKTTFNYLFGFTFTKKRELLLRLSHHLGPWLQYRRHANHVVLWDPPEGIRHVPPLPTATVGGRTWDQLWQVWQDHPEPPAHALPLQVYETGVTLQKHVYLPVEGHASGEGKWQLELVRLQPWESWVEAQETYQACPRLCWVTWPLQVEVEGRRYVVTEERVVVRKSEAE